MTIWPYTFGFCDRLGVGIWVAVCFDFAKYFFIEFIQNVKTCRVRMFKTLRCFQAI